MIQSYLFPLSKNESKCISSIGWEFIKSNKDRLVEIDLDISSIDFGFEAARFTHENKVYGIYNSYLECLGGGVTKRILLGKLIDTEKETVNVSGMIPDDIVEEYLNLVNEHAKLEKEHADLRKEVDEGKEKLSEITKEYDIVPSSETPTFDSLVEDIREVATVRYNKGYNSGISYADGRNNTESMSYKTGYNAGVAAADGRENPESANWKYGWDNGHLVGYNQGVIDADNRPNANSVNWKDGYNLGVAQADGRPLPGSVNYQSGYNVGYNAGASAVQAGFMNNVQVCYFDITCFYIKKSSYTGALPIGSNFTNRSGIVSIGDYHFIMCCWAGALNGNGWSIVHGWHC